MIITHKFFRDDDGQEKQEVVEEKFDEDDEERTPSREEQLEEARARFKLLGIYDETVRQFFEDGLLSYSLAPLGAYYWLDDETMKSVREFEEKFGALVYSVIRTNTDFGFLDSYLYVSSSPSEWEDDRQDIKDGFVFVYVKNVDRDDYSEFGRIGIKLGVAGGLIRTI